MNSKRGFTLIELLIAIVIAGVLVAVAVPAYGNYIVQARRADAKQELAKLVNVMENCRSMNQTYDNCLGGNDNSALNNSLSSDVGKYYAATTSTKIEDNKYVLVLEAKDSQKRDASECQLIGIDSNGVKFSKKVPATDNDIKNPDAGNCWK